MQREQTNQQALHLRDYVKRSKEETSSTNVLNGSPRIVVKRVAIFPDLYKNEKGEYLGIIDPSTGENIEAPWSAYMLALMWYGYRHVGKRGDMIGADVFDPPGPGPAGFPEAKNAILEACKPRYNYQADQKFWFPTLSVNGYNEYSPLKDGDIYTPCYIAAIQQGKMLRDWDNNIQDIYPNSDKDRLAEAKARLTELPRIVEESEWVLTASSIPHKGIRNYHKSVSFQKKLDRDQLALFKNYLSLDKCPGWTGISSSGPNHPKEGVYRYSFQTTWDSSD